MWAGTKLLALAAVAIALSWSPTWPVTAVAGGLVALTWLAGRIPAGARPRLPMWLIASLGVSAGFALVAGGDPVVHVFGFGIGLGGLEQFARFLAVSVVLLTAALVISFTTQLADVAPALRRLGRPLRWVRLPVDEWALSIALAMRSFPLLLDEGRTMFAARRLRAPAEKRADGRRHSAIGTLFGLFTTAIVVALRRGREMGTAIDNRGGVRPLPASPRRPGLVDAVAGLAAAGMLVAAALL
jgi:energy-coupling factor transport system permease protein